MHAVDETPAIEPIAIVGTACRLPGGIDSSKSMWELLRAKGTVRTAKVPANRFNIDSYLHENLDRPGSFNVPGGYFLDGNLEDFDPSFFNISPVEAMWLDPQQRKMLEVTYECFESAGIALESVAGTNTGVFVGSFTADYQQMSFKEADFRHSYAATGVDPGIISTRLGNVFDLRGPNSTINTACSSSIYAVHQACNALRARDCDAAVAGGVNLILTVDQHINTAKLGVLSPTSTCHTFDISADGYGRGEGAGALYLRRLSDALRDGDPVRAIIRGSAVNSNGKVPGYGITYPSIRGQELVVRAAYAQARLDPLQTAYVECHGTGTPVGDPIETQAIATAMNDTRPADKPLIVGAVKPSIGHSEAASGIFAVIKAAMMTESGIIPGIYGLETVNPAIREKDWNIVISKDTVPWPENGSQIRRAGVSSFGYGGTNGHVIVEEPRGANPFSLGRRKQEASYGFSGNATKRPYLVGFSAHDRRTLERNIEAHARVASDYHLPDLAYTLMARRSRFPVRGFTVATEGSVEEALQTSAMTIGTAPATPPQLGFVFTGQGAQWPALGAAAMDAFPSFLATIRALDKVLQSLEFASPSWSLEDALRQPAGETNRINDAEISQPVCTAIQIAVVDLFHEWDITPKVTVGHSSGEIAAAYAAGVISAPEAMLAAYLRGYAVSKHASVGAMLAVGLGSEDAQLWIPEDGSITVACQNSPSSTTLSGSCEAISALAKELQEKQIFARELPTGRAYHSQHMLPVGQAYDEMLIRATSALSDDVKFSWRRPRATWISSVTGAEFTDDQIEPTYWSRNLVSRVRFDEAIAALGQHTALTNVKAMVEIGPHPALSSPFKQICQANDLKGFTYTASLVRNKDSAEQLLRTAGALFVQNYPIDVHAVNETGEVKQFPRLLVDLPPYQWNYEKTYWAEPRLSDEQRHPTHGRHDLLGSKMFGLSSKSMAWKNFIRHRDIPWLKDHKLGNEDIFPAAAHLSMAAEALWQVCDVRGEHIESVTFRDVVLTVALAIPDNEDGIETQLRFDEVDDAWFKFSVQSWSEGQWNVHCEGLIAANHRSQPVSGERDHPVDTVNLKQRIAAKHWYDGFKRVGFEYGPTFQTMSNIRTNQNMQQAASDVNVLTKSTAAMVGESRYLLHPSTIDGCLHLVIVSINSGRYAEMQHGVVPIKFEEITVWPQKNVEAITGQAVGWCDEQDGRYFDCGTKLVGPDGQTILDGRNLRCVSYEAAVPQENSAKRDREPYVETVWKADVSTLTTKQATNIFESASTEGDMATKFLELAEHKKHVSTVLIISNDDSSMVEAVSAMASPLTSVIATMSFDVKNKFVSEQLPPNVNVIPKESNEDYDWNGALAGPHDVVIVGKQRNGWNGPDLNTLQQIASHMDRKARAVFCIPKTSVDSFGALLQNAGFSGIDFLCQCPETSLIASTLLEDTPNEHVFDASRVTVLRSDDEPLTWSPSGLGGDDIVETYNISQVGEADLARAGKIIVDDTAGTLWSNLNDNTFGVLKTALTGEKPVVWLTSGVNQGVSLDAAMCMGLLRVVRSEFASAKVLWLDVDRDQDLATMTEALNAKLGHVMTKNSVSDTEFWLRDGVFHVPRVVPHKQLNQQFSANSGQAQESILPQDKTLKGKVLNGQIIFREEKDAPLEQGEVRLRVEYANTTNPTLVSGTITNAHAGLDQSVVGRNAVVFTTNLFQTAITTRLGLCVFLGDGQVQSAMVASLPSLVSGLNAVKGLANARKGEHILALPSASASSLAALSVLAASSQLHLTVVAATLAQKENLVLHHNIASDSIEVAESAASVYGNLKQKVQEADVIISNDFTPLAQEVWRSIPAGARFVLDGGVLDNAPDAIPFCRGASFFSTGLSRLQKREPQTVAKLLGDATAFLEENGRFQSKPALVDISDAAHVKTSGLRASVIKYAYGFSRVKIQPMEKTIAFSPDAAYILVGCLGGLGRSLTAFMMERGARDFVFLSRSGADKADAAVLVKSLREAGATADVHRGDAANQADVNRVVSEVTKTRPIRGVVHAAMVLQDGMFDSMSLSQFQTVVEPKAKGAQTLHTALQDHELDFFVMTSSISATLGNPGQANYCAANSYLDALAWHRTLRGLPAVSLILPMVLGVGVVAENSSIEAALAKKAMYGVDEREMLRGFETAMLQPVPAIGKTPSLGNSQIILGLEPTFLAAAIRESGSTDAAYWYPDARFGSLRTTVDDMSKQGSSGDNNMAAAMLAADAAAVLLGCDFIIKKLSAMLLIPIEEFELEGRSVGSYGLDSMVGTDLRNWLFNQFGLQMSFQTLLGAKMSVTALATAILQQLMLEDTTRPVSEVPTGSNQETAS
ncbi:hypothetical protein N7447_009524 [Penicillium robsamsonii]|uniref:uncharacterized protein n=1 Tax=Penicillium robsamsonii TaxID=1792511 RepID=UPI0025478DCE|nr:uncharacterized protein N7447_009524 [Penicillium robsamsonii]KAJ5817291.1 hypothetical protein N7447_009524 [Penicillium robsamsonii]